MTPERSPAAADTGPVGGPLRFEPPDAPPQLTPLAARSLLRLLLDVHSQRPDVEQQTLVWDRTA
jgi:hypothetical protein